MRSGVNRFTPGLWGELAFTFIFPPLAVSQRLVVRYILVKHSPRLVVNFMAGRMNVECKKCVGLADRRHETWLFKVVYSALDKCVLCNDLFCFRTKCPWSTFF